MHAIATAWLRGERAQNKLIISLRTVSGISGRFDRPSWDFFLQAAKIAAQLRSPPHHDFVHPLSGRFGGEGGVAAVADDALKIVMGGVEKEYQLAT